MQGYAWALSQQDKVRRETPKTTRLLVWVMSAHEVQRGVLDVDYGLIGVLGGAAFACAVVVHLWVASCREARRVERRVAGLRDEYREEV